MEINFVAVMFWAAVGCIVGAVFGASAGVLTFGIAIAVTTLIGFLL